MKEQTINHLACWLSILLIDAFLYIWYNYIFYEAWLKHNNINAAEFIANRGFVPYAVSLFVTVLVVYMLAWIFIGLKVDDFQSGIGIAMAIAVVFTFLNVLVRDLYLFRPYVISFIDGGASVFSCIIAGAILGGWRSYETNDKTG